MPIDLTDFYSEGMEEEVVSSVEELRQQVRQYNRAKLAEAEAAERKKEAKGRIDELFVEIPDQYKAVQADTPKEVAGGEIFSREKKTITIDGNVILMKDRIDTSFSRDKFFKYLDGEITAAQTAGQDAVEDALKAVKDHIVAGLNPHRTQVISVEPVKETK